jgi:hypothetical protein
VTAAPPPRSATTWPGQSSSGHQTAASSRLFSAGSPATLCVSPCWPRKPSGASGAASLGCGRCSHSRGGVSEGLPCGRASFRMGGFWPNQHFRTTSRCFRRMWQRRRCTRSICCGTSGAQSSLSTQRATAGRQPCHSTNSPWPWERITHQVPQAKDGCQARAKVAQSATNCHKPRQSALAHFWRRLLWWRWKLR